MLIAMNVAPRGLPRWRRRAWEFDGLDEGEMKVWSSEEEVEVSWLNGEEEEVEEEEDLRREGFSRVVFRRNNCVIAMPMEAKERDVRSQARNVLSIIVHVLALFSTPLLSSLYSLAESTRYE